jgi:sugar transferase (PEP-CTERM/EpsH1 system associated)
MARFAVEPPLAEVPFVLDMVDVDSAKWARLADHHRGPRRWVYRRESAMLRTFEAVAARRARITMLVNDRERDIMREIDPGVPVSVVSNGIDLGAFRPREEPAPSSTVVFCGVMNYAPNERGVSWFVNDVWPMVREARPDARFQIVGASPTRTVRALASAAHGVEVTGAVAEVQPYLWQAGVSVAPLLVAQGLQNKVLEALAAGLPVVVSRAAGAGLPAEARRGCVIADDPREFADGVISLLNLPPRDRRAVTGDLGALDWPTRLSSLEQTFRCTNGQELHAS